MKAFHFMHSVSDDSGHTDEALADLSNIDEAAHTECSIVQSQSVTSILELLETL